ncbi:FKBP-type peptidyl-prolyl cis-trans isomerase, partial [Providencia burhodogranariea]|uniref:FKBP-type peptidyl-prolyl cis-trans isomerase n=1 Tax=Providencia burhodogranariea TaxID=516074 RepID=UPI001F235854
LNQQIALLKQKEEALAKVDVDKKSIQASLATNLDEKKKLELQNAELAKQNKERELQIKRLESDIDTKAKKASEVDQQLVEANKQISALKRDTEKLKTVDTQYQAQSAEFDKLKKQLADNSKLQKGLTSAQEKLKKLQAELEQQKSLTSEKTLKSQIMDLNKQILELRDENEKLKAKPIPKSSVLSGMPPKKQANENELNMVAEQNNTRNQKIIEDITKQKYSKLDSFTYYKILQKGKPITNVKNKKITFIMREQLTDGTVTVLYTDKNPVTLPYNELPVPLNSFIEKAGEGGMVKVYIKPEGGYGVKGIPGQIPPNSMSIIDLKIISAN